jgi:hypothetical protein
MEAKRRDICTLVSIAIATLYQKKNRTGAAKARL